MKVPDIKGGMVATSAVSMALALNACGSAERQQTQSIGPELHGDALVFPTQPMAIDLIKRLAEGHEDFEKGGRIFRKRPTNSHTLIAGSIAMCLTNNELAFTSLRQSSHSWGIDTTMHYQTIARNLYGLCKGNGQINVEKWRLYIDRKRQNQQLHSPDFADTQI